MRNDDKEIKRLQCLFELEILDTSKETCYDDITILAAHICGTPISLISLVDEKRQWFKSKYGLEINETPKDVAFCAYAIEQDELFIVDDPLNDERFKNNPLVTDGLKICFYAGIPLKTKCGNNIGTLCIIDTIPRTLSDGQKEALKRLGRQTQELLTFRLEKKHSSLAKEWSHIIFNNSNDMMGIVKVDQQNGWPLQTVNPAFCAKVNVTAELVIGKPVEKVISSSLLPVTFENFAKVINSKKSYKFESSSNLNGVETFYESIISPKLNENHEVTHLLIVARDITERKRMKFLFLNKILLSLKAQNSQH